MEWFTQLAQGLQDAPVLQGLLAAFCTFILEDPTTVGSGLLVADGLMNYWAALIGLSLGIAGGDFGLYLLGRLAQGRVCAWGLVDQARLDAGGAWFDRNVVSVVLGSRFLPGLRMPTYVAAGVLKVSPYKFLATAIGASVVWTLVLLSLTIRLGEGFLEEAGRWKWPLGLGLVAFIALVQFIAMRRRKKAVCRIGADGQPHWSVFEFWPAWLFYLPVGLWYTWLGLIHRSWTLPTAANPRIYSGGMILESKSQILALAPPEVQEWIAAWTVVDALEGDTTPERLDRARAALAEAGLDYPLVAKPDVGQRGAGVQRILDQSDLEAYLAAFPGGERVILQEMVPYGHEAGVLVYRYPGQARGQLFSITLKRFPEVVGDGQRCLRELILEQPRAARVSHLYFGRHQGILDTILAEGERFALVFSGNHCQGAIFEDGARLASEALTRRFTDLAAAIPDFHFGRFDLRFESEEALARGQGFQIVEINGASAEATHIWDARMRLPQAYRTLFAQWRILYRIGAAMRRQGHRPIGLWRMGHDLLAYGGKKRSYPGTH